MKITDYIETYLKNRLDQETSSFIWKLLVLKNGINIEEVPKEKFIDTISELIQELKEMELEIYFFQEELGKNIPEYVTYEGETYQHYGELRCEDEEIKLRISKHHEADQSNLYVSLQKLGTPSTTEISEFKENYERISEELRRRAQEDRKLDDELNSNWDSTPINNYCPRCNQTPCMCSDPY